MRKPSLVLIIMLIEPSPSALTYCTTCQTLICKGDLRLTIKPLANYHRKHYKSYAYYYHLPCYRPKLPAPINQKELLLKGVDVERLEQITTWVNDWNQQFSAEKVPEKYTKMAILAAPVAHPRLLLEVFGYLSVREIEQIAAFACKAWYTITRHEDLWKSMFIRQFTPRETEPDTSYRSLFILIRLKACWHCNSVLLPRQIYMKCPYYDMLLCKKCSNLPACKIVTLNSYQKSLNISNSTVDFLKFPVFLHKKVRSCYMRLAAERMITYAEVRRNRLIAELEESYSAEIASEVLTEMRNFRLEWFYKLRVRAKSEVVRELTRFCGKSESAGNFNQRVAELVTRLGSINAC